MKRKGISSLVILIVFIITIIATIYIYNSRFFERNMPIIIVEDQIYWNLKDSIKINIKDQSGISHYKVIMKNKDIKRVLQQNTFKEPSKHKDLKLEINYSKIGGYLKTSLATLLIEVVDSSMWNFLSGNRIVSEYNIIIDQKKPLVTVVDHSFGISKGGAALVIFEAKDEYINKLFIQTNFGKKFEVQPFFKKDYYISLIAWPIAQRSFSATIVAVDKAGNKSRKLIPFERRQRYYLTSKIRIGNRFLEGKIAQMSNDFNLTRNIKDNLTKFILINEDIRLKNEKIIHNITSNVPSIAISSFNVVPFYPLKNAKAVAGFGDKRYYYYKNRKVTTSYHVGIDLASVKMSDIKVQNGGKVVFAQANGIYGNLSIIYHGMGLYTIYGHSSKILVDKEDQIVPNQVIAITGKTGLALGDHVHFGTLVQGIEVRPAEWMDPNWIKLNITNIIKKAKKLILEK